MKIVSKYATLVAFIIMTGLIAFPVINASSLGKTIITSAAVYAQSQSESQQQTSQPPEEQKPQTGTVHIQQQE